jgi:hypothetical protein
LILGNDSRGRQDHFSRNNDFVAGVRSTVGRRGLMCTGTYIYDLHTRKAKYELKAVPYGGITLPWRVNDKTISRIY